MWRGLQAEQVTPAQWSGPPPIGDHTLQETLVHTLYAERAWRYGWAGQGRAEPLPEAVCADAGSLAARWREESAAMRAYLASLSDEDVQGPFYDEDVRVRYVLWQVIAHVSYHGMQHRSEAAMLLTHFGHSPVRYRHGLLAGRARVAGRGCSPDRDEPSAGPRYRLDEVTSEPSTSAIERRPLRARVRSTSAISWRMSVATPSSPATASA